MSEVRAPDPVPHGPEPADDEQRPAPDGMDGTPVAGASSASLSPVAADVLAAGRRALIAPGLRALGPRRISAVYLWIAFVILFGLLEPDVYLSSVTMQLIFSEGAVTCL